MNKLKVIHIAHASHSYFANEKDSLIDIVLNDWYFKTAVQLKKYYPKIEVECWAPEKLNKKYEEITKNRILLRFFPTTFSPIYALDFSLSMLKELRKEIKKSKKEDYGLVIHLHEYHNLHGLWIASFFKNIRIIAQHHGGSSPFKHLKESKKKRFFFLFFILAQLWENIILKNIKVFYALSNEELDYLRSVAPDSKSIFQTMGIEDIYFKKIKKDSARKKLKIPLDKKIILYIGRISEVKGVRYLIAAMENLKEHDLYILGYGNERESLENYSKEKAQSNVYFLGGVFKAKKLLYLSSADCLVLPSSKEGAPVTVMEAFARNLPVVVTNIGGIPLMVENNINGAIIRQKNTEDIINSVKEVLTWKKDIRKYANIYKWNRIIKNTVKDYQNGKN
ncbi:MAG: glycosyltransferase family 4 protein [Nanoarchaeota archaeon]|nr:glycosyltransferase family 4 protein [Nanoarchaeota archaeon]